MLEQLLCRQIGWLPPIEDRLSDIRCEIAEADEPREIGPADPFPLGERGKRDAFALGECRVEPARSEEHLINRASGFAANGSVPLITILISRPERCSRTGTDKSSISSSFTPCDGVAGGSSSAKSRSGRRWMSIWSTLTSIRSITAARTARLPATGNSGQCLP